MVDKRDLKSCAERRVGSNPTTPNYFVACSKSIHPKYKHASLIFKDGDMIAVANNTIKRHAEIAVLEITKLLGYNHVTLVSVRVTKDGKLANAKPCRKCMAYINYGPIHIISILYSNAKGVIVKL